jgi:acyl dehydratase
VKTILKKDLQDYVDTETLTSSWFLIDQDRINKFADCTLDHQFIHVDPALAAKTEFGSTIAHGFLTLSLLPHLALEFGIQIEGCYMGINYGFDKIRFLTPVKVGSRVRATGRLISVVEKKPGQFMLGMSIEVEIEGSERPALVAHWLTMQVTQ